MESKGLEYVRNQIVKLKDDLQHYTMVEKDSALESQIRYDLEQFETIEKELKALELIKKYNIRPSDFHYHTTYHIYLCNMSFAEKDEIMSEKEYELLKEVLL